VQSRLVSFMINFNNLTSTIPAWPLPTPLTMLDVSNNQLTGGLPPDWNLSAVQAALTLVSVSKNSLSGTGCRVQGAGNLLQAVATACETPAELSAGPHVPRRAAPRIS
jgi:hypothetical protein